MTRAPRPAAAALAVAFLALHLPYLPQSLEDLDSINFALGLHRFDVAQHQPHPPGYPVFIAVARLARTVIPSDARALSLVAVIAGALGVLALFAFYGALESVVAGEARPSDVRRAGAEGRGASEPHRPASEADRALAVGRDRRAWLAFAATLVATTAPLYWFTAARPLSDTAGLAAAVAVQALTLLATTRSSLGAAAVLAGIATGIRSQVFWLTAPLLVAVGIARLFGRTAVRGAAAILGAFGAGCLLWAVPLLVVAGGPAAYWRAVFGQGAEDLSGIQMLWTSPTPRVFVSAIYYAFVAPWALWSVAAVVLVFAGLGAWLTLRYSRPAFATMAVAYGPYLLFDIVFQETFTTRYALPLVIPAAWLAVRGASAFGWRPALALAVLLSMYDAHLGGTSIAAYAREKAPAFRLLDDMAAASSAAQPVLAADRREQLDLRRPFAWASDRAPAFRARLPSPPQREWLELVKYWNAGGRQPVWFVADPLRTDIDLVQHDHPVRYRWRLPYPVLLGGVRPNEMDWYRIDRPMWYVGERWALTPEAAGVTDPAARGLSGGPIGGWVHRSIAGGGTVVVGGRNFGSEPARVSLRLGSWFVASMRVGSGAFLHFAAVPRMGLARDAAEYQPVSISADVTAPVAIEQFDAEPAGRVVFGFGPGWNEQEYNPATGKRWRWLSERGEIRAVTSGRALVLHLEGESPSKYFARPSRLLVRVGDTVASDDALSSDFTLDVTIPAAVVARAGAETIIALETDQVYVPAERSSRTQDRRHLGLRIFRCELRDASR